MSSQAIPIGNFENKYETRNPVARMLVESFLATFDQLVSMTRPQTIHEVGCGEGMLTKRLAQTNAAQIKASDIDQSVFESARASLPGECFSFQEKSIYDLAPDQDRADLIVCCEVLEHLEDPRLGLEALWRLNADHYIFSVPCEPTWRILNMCRGKYISDFGNTPGHLQHWSREGFCKMLSARFDMIEVRSPLPWTMVLCARRCDAQ